jgi:hypothetical protein
LRRFLGEPKDQETHAVVGRVTQLVEGVTPDWFRRVLAFTVAHEAEPVVVVDYQPALDASEVRTFFNKTTKKREVFTTVSRNSELSSKRWR